MSNRHVELRQDQSPIDPRLGQMGLVQGQLRQDENQPPMETSLTMRQVTSNYPGPEIGHSVKDNYDYDHFYKMIDEELANMPI